jgi:hypothetical protein
MRFTWENWKKFFMSKKKTTIRLKEKKQGFQNAVGGSRYKPIIFGRISVGKPKASRVCDLTDVDAKSDGFNSLGELLLELGKLNKDIEFNSKIFIYPVKVTKRIV